MNNENKKEKRILKLKEFLQKYEYINYEIYENQLVNEKKYEILVNITCLVCIKKDNDLYCDHLKKIYKEIFHILKNKI